MLQLGGQLGIYHQHGITQFFNRNLPDKTRFHQNVSNHNTYRAVNLYPAKIAKILRINNTL